MSMIDVVESAEGPIGYQFAVVQEGKVVGWTRDEDTSALLAWSLRYKDFIEFAAGIGLMDLVWAYRGQVARDSKTMKEAN